MKRSMMQTYARHSDKAVALYQKAFDAKLVDSYPNEDGTFMHAELDVYGQIVSVAEAPEGWEAVTGTTMHFCLHFGEGNEALVYKAYDVLKDGAKILQPPEESDYSPLVVDLIDAFGVRWGLFV